jgi:hypothetical protein
VLPGDVPLQELPIGLGSLVGGDQAAELVEELAERSLGHRWVLRNKVASTLLQARGRPTTSFFFEPKALAAFVTKLRSGQILFNEAPN